MNAAAGFFRREVIAVSLVCLLVISAAIEPSLLSFRHLRNIFFEAAPLALLASAFALSLLFGFLDFSFAGTAALAGVACAALLQTPELRPAGISQTLMVCVAAVGVFALAGGISCFKVYAVTAFRMPPAFSGFITGGVLEGLAALIMTGQDGEARVFRPAMPLFTALGTGRIGRDPVYSLPAAVLVAAVALGAVALILRRLKWEDKYTIVTSVFNSLYVPGTMMPLRAVFKPVLPIAAVSGALYALGGMMMAAKAQHIGAMDRLDFMNGVTLTVLAGAFVGKASIFGGKNSFLGAAGGMVLVTAVFYSLDFVLVAPGVQTCLKYLVIAIAVCKDIHSRYLPGRLNQAEPVKRRAEQPQTS